MQPRYDDFDDRPRRKKKKRRSTAPFLLIGCLAGGVVLVLGLLAVGGIAILLYLDRGTQPNEFVGAWKGEFLLPNRHIKVIYTFHKNGRFSQDTLNFEGRRVDTFSGNWSFHQGEIEIHWDRGGFECARVTFINNNTLHYEIVDHTD